MWDHDGVRELLVLAGGCVFAFGWAWLAVYAPTATAMLIGAGLYAAGRAIVVDYIRRAR